MPAWPKSAALCPSTEPQRRSGCPPCLQCPHAWPGSSSCLPPHQASVSARSAELSCTSRYRPKLFGAAWIKSSGAFYFFSNFSLRYRRDTLPDQNQAPASHLCLPMACFSFPSLPKCLPLLQQQPLPDFLPAFTTCTAASVCAAGSGVAAILGAQGAWCSQEVTPGMS